MGEIIRARSSDKRFTMEIDTDWTHWSYEGGCNLVEESLYELPSGEFVIIRTFWNGRNDHIFEKASALEAVKFFDMLGRKLPEPLWKFLAFPIFSKYSTYGAKYCPVVEERTGANFAFDRLCKKWGPMKLGEYGSDETLYHHGHRLVLETDSTIFDCASRVKFLMPPEAADWLYLRGIIEPDFARYLTVPIVGDPTDEEVAAAASYWGGNTFRMHGECDQPSYEAYAPASESSEHSGADCRECDEPAVDPATTFSTPDANSQFDPGYNNNLSPASEPSDQSALDAPNSDCDVAVSNLNRNRGFKMSLENWCRRKHRWDVPLGEELQTSPWERSPSDGRSSYGRRTRSHSAVAASASGSEGNRPRRRAFAFDDQPRVAA